MDGHGIVEVDTLDATDDEGVNGTMARDSMLGLILLGQLMIKRTSAETIDKLLDLLSYAQDPEEKGERLLELLEANATEEELLEAARE